MRTLDLQLAMLHWQKAQGADVDEHIADTLIAMLKDAYVCGDIGIEYLEDVTAAILRGEPMAVLQPGERILRREVERPSRGRD